MWIRILTKSSYLLCNVLAIPETSKETECGLSSGHALLGSTKDVGNLDSQTDWEDLLLLLHFFFFRFPHNTHSFEFCTLKITAFPSFYIDDNFSLLFPHTPGGI